MLEKCKKHMFGKDIYLLGKDSDGITHWLESPSWDCKWYWGFGYIETYTNNHSIENSRDISSHSHFDGLVWYKNDKGDYIYHINDKGSSLIETVLTDNQAWELSDLMKRFYTFKESAEIFHRGNANYTSNTGVDSTDKELAKHINEVVLPAIFARVLELLSPA